MEDICEGGFFNRDYFMRELPDEFFSEQGAMFQEDKLIFCRKHPMDVGGIESSVYMQINHEDNSVEMGPKVADDFKYEIIPDIDNVDTVFNWYLGFMKGKRLPLPYFPPSSPIFPPRALKIKKHFAVQKYMMIKGFGLAEPTFSEIQNLSDFGPMYSKYQKTMHDKNITEIGEDDLLFYAYHDPKCDYPTSRCLSMQFNPFHPRSYHMILDMRQEGKVYSGVYSYNGRDVDFIYNLDDTRYRMHSDAWLQVTFGSADPVIECFDLVGNFPFASELGSDLRVMSYVDEKCTFRDSIGDEPQKVEPIFIEPFVSSGISEHPYSVIGPWNNIIELGIKDHFYVPYATQRYNSDSVLGPPDEPYLDITALTTFDDNYIRVKKYCGECLDKKLNLIEVKSCACEKRRKFDVIGRNLKQLGYANYYIRDYGSSIRVYVRSKEYGTVKFRVIPYTIHGFPKNGKESIVYPFRLVPLLTFLSIKHIANLKEYVQLNEMRRYMPEIKEEELLGVQTEVCELEMNAFESLMQGMSVHVIRVENVDDRGKRFILSHSKTNGYSVRVEKDLLYLKGQDDSMREVFQDLKNRNFQVHWETADYGNILS